MEKKIIGILSEIKENKELESTVSGETKIIDDIGLDSLEIINFVLRVEDEFNIEINFEEFDFENLKTIKSFSEFIKSSLEVA